LIAIIFNLERENESQSVCCESNQHSFGQGNYAVGGARAGKRGLIGLGVNPGSCGSEYTPICASVVVLSAGSGWSMAWWLRWQIEQLASVDPAWWCDTLHSVIPTTSSNSRVTGTMRRRIELRLRIR
jgi:hypothetical protein